MVSKAEEILQSLAQKLEEDMPDCLFVIVALTDDQTNTHYISNMQREDGIETMEEMIEGFQKEAIMRSLN